MGYNHIMNIGYWIDDMRDDALEPTYLNDRNIVVVNVGGGTNFTTLGMMEPFKECNIIEGDVNLPFPTNYVNRAINRRAPDSHISGSSSEPYWEAHEDPYNREAHKS
ncbi:hypothetical protein Godav_024761 [Gossypium davidsonii]|uniref:Methyltransferase n=1 Tax=Gossypium davidsonii TaxID=34287 RepID=A0A7J8TJ36_GOSDV|nr:hypothetical protein [Gossypium davidsonii]